MYLKYNLISVFCRAIFLRLYWNIPNGTARDPIRFRNESLFDVKNLEPVYLLLKNSLSLTTSCFLNFASS